MFDQIRKKKESAHYGNRRKKETIQQRWLRTNRSENQNVFDMPLCKAAFLADVQTFYLHLYPPSRLDGGLRMSQYFGMKRDEAISIGPNLRSTGIYPDTEIFASMLSTITRRTSSRERRAIFQATAGYVRIYTYTYTLLANPWDTRTRERGENRLLCWHLEHLPNAICSRACTRDSDDTRVFVKFAAHPYYIIIMPRRCVNIILVLTWNRYISRNQICVIKLFASH